MSSTHAKRGDIEGLRAIAVGLVLLYHGQLAAVGGGFIGVDVFFVISGFLITGSLLTEATTTGTVGLAAFYARRARRLLPAAALVLVSTAIAVRALLPVTMWRDFGGDIVAAAAYVLNWRLAARSVDYLAEDVVASPVQHFWSLAIEEQFYFVWPVLILLIALLARKRGWSLRAALAIGLTILVIAPSLWWSITSTADQPARAFFDTGTRMWELAAGALVALVASRTPPFPKLWFPVKWTALIVLIGAGMLLDESAPWPGALAALVVIPTALLLLLGGRGDDPVERLLSLRPMQLVGAWSYSLYLWHWPMLAILGARWGGLSTSTAMLIVAASFVPAVASLYLIENPLRFAPALRHSTRLTLSTGANLSLLGLTAGLLVMLAAPSSNGPSTLVLPTPDVSASELAAPSPTPTAPSPTPSPTPTGIPSATPSPSAAPTPSPTPAPTPSPTASPQPAAPLGAWALGSNPSSLTRQELLSALAATRSITPAPTDATDDLPRVYPDRCHAAPDASKMVVCTYGDEASDVHVALVGDSKAGQWGDTLELTAARRGWRLTYLLRSTCEFSSSMAARGGGPDEKCQEWGRDVVAHLTADPADVVLTSQVSSYAWVEDGGDAIEAMVDGMIDAYDQLEAAGNTVVVLWDNPSPDGPVYECVAEHLSDLDACTFDRLDDSGGRRAQRAVLERTGRAGIDLADFICPSTLCMPIIGDVLVYRQGSHISATYARSLVDALDARLSPLVRAAAGG